MKQGKKNCKGNFFKKIHPFKSRMWFGVFKKKIQMIKKWLEFAPKKKIL
jgi:hypothetical protein